MKRVLQQGKFEPAGVLAAMLLPLLLLWAAPAGAAKTAGPRAGAGPGAHAATEAGCRDGWRRVGTLKDSTLGRSWAVVASCVHPAWPAHLEPAARWKPLPRRVAVGSRVVVVSPSIGTAMHLQGRTITPGRIGQTVGVRLINGVRVKARLVAPGIARMQTAARWRQP